MIADHMGRTTLLRSLKGVALILSLLWMASACPAQKKEKLNNGYKQWLEEDVVYIITKEEKENFLKLATDDARDRFIAQFWEIRNPNPGSPTNEFKDEIYQRIAFANSRFSVGSAEEGWRTDRGHVYILLGPPQQKQVYRSAGNLYPLEIWFYSTGQVGLPNFFYLMFYDRDITGDYRFYSPYFDGPDKLTTGVEAINDPASAYKMIQDSVGPEVARITLSLIPGEPVDPSMGTKSLESDLLLSTLRGYNNLPAYRNEIARRYKMRENVTSRMLLSGRNMDVLTFPIRDSRGLTRLDYALHLRNASDMTLAKDADGRYSYSLGINVKVFGPDNKLVFSQEKHVADTMDKRRMEEIQDKSFGYEGLLPLPPGKYRIAFELIDYTKKTSYVTEREVTVPQPEQNGFVVPEILTFKSAEEIPDPVARDLTPFTMGGVRFHPLPESSPVLQQDAPLQIAYQIWARPSDPRSLSGQKLLVEYGLGLPSLPGSSKTLRDEVAMEQFDVTGSLVSGKRLSLADRPSGNYALTLTVQRAGTDEKSYATAHYRVLGEVEARRTWEIDQPDIGKDAEAGLLDQERGLALLAQGQPDESRKWLLHALKLGHSNDRARAVLVEAYFAKKDYAAVKSLYTDVGVTEATDSQTLIKIAASLQHLGDSQKAENLLQDSIGLRPEDGPLYLALADVYRQNGDLKKALETEKKGKSYLGIN
jgi:GWxTD domain-containing protein